MPCGEVDDQPRKGRNGIRCDRYHAKAYWTEPLRGGTRLMISATCLRRAWAAAILKRDPLDAAFLDNPEADVSALFVTPELAAGRSRSTMRAGVMMLSGKTGWTEPGKCLTRLPEITARCAFDGLRFPSSMPGLSADFARAPRRHA